MQQPQLDFKHRCNCNGKELRKTHYSLGTFEWNPQTEYTTQYPAKASNTDAPQMDSVKLRKTNFILGDDNPPLQTTNMIESEPLQSIPPEPNQLNENLKNDLRKSHFILGNYEPNYNTTFKAEYYDKSNYKTKDDVNFYNVERKLRTQNFNFGTDSNDYLTETQAKFTKPIINKNDLPNQKISTEGLQKNHHIFGIFPNDYNTTQRISYPPKKADMKLYTKNLRKTNFILGEDKPILKSVNQETYIKHPIKVKDNLNKSELINDLRKHHFEFGKENIPMQTTNNFEFQDPGIADNAQPTLDNQKLRQSNWSLGDKKLEPDNLYLTEYADKMTQKPIIKNPPIDNKNFTSHFKITGNGPVNYQSNYRANYIPLQSQIDPNDKKKIDDVVKNIKNSHFNLGEMNNDYGTTMSNSYQYDPNYKNEKIKIDQDLINDLRASHYKLGDDPFYGQTTQRRDYVPYNVRNIKSARPDLQRNHFNFGNEREPNKLDGKTIYMTDFVPKPIPVDDENDCWC